jgi:hypothetical protein
LIFTFYDSLSIVKGLPKIGKILNFSSFDLRELGMFSEKRGDVSAMKFQGSLSVGHVDAKTTAER